MSRKKDCSGWLWEISIRLVKLWNVLGLTAAFALVWYLGYSSALGVLPQDLKFWAPPALFSVLYTAFGRVYDAFLLSISRVSEMSLSQILAAMISDTVLYVLLCIAGEAFLSIWPILLAFLLQAGLAVSWCFLSNKWYFHRFSPRKCVIICGCRDDLQELLGEYGLKRKFSVIRSVTSSECLSDMPGCLDGSDTVFLWGVCSHNRNIILKYCVEHNIRSYLIPRIGDMLVNGGRIVHMCHMPLLSVGRFSASPGYYCLKRLSDILICCTALVLLSPVMLITAAAIKLTDGGPVFYKQTRLTKNRKEFQIIKFRSMRVDAELDGVARLSSGREDPRVTRVGHLIRAVRIDELPQLFNIIKGDMSIVGPRPERPEISAEYEKELPEFSLRLQVPAGLTGYAQVYGKYNTPPYDKLQMDLMYISRAGFWEDLRIMIATVKILFLSESTEGISQEHTTAAK